MQAKKIIRLWNQTQSKIPNESDSQIAFATELENIKNLITKQHRKNIAEELDKEVDDDLDRIKKNDIRCKLLHE